MLRATQQWVIEQGLPEISLSEDGRAELESKVHAYSFFQKSKESYLCSKLSCPHAVVVSFEEFKHFKSASWLVLLGFLSSWGRESKAFTLQGKTELLGVWATEESVQP